MSKSRFIGLDLHKHYAVMVAVDSQQGKLFGTRKIKVANLGTWAAENLTKQDVLAIEMTTNTWEVYDVLIEHVKDIVVVHPPQISLITKAHVKTDNRAAHDLAKLLAGGLLESIWIPDKRTRQIRALLAQREKRVKLSTKTKNRLHAVLHRLSVEPSDKLFSKDNWDWWLDLVDDPAERTVIHSDLQTLEFAREQIKFVEQGLKKMAAEDDRVWLLVQLPGIRYITALTILAAIGDIMRFPTAKHLVGYAGLGARVYSSGQRHATGRLTKTGRKELRTAMVQAAHIARMTHPHWQEKYAQLIERMKAMKAVTAIARMMLASVWHILTKKEADRHAIPEKVQSYFMEHCYDLGKANRPLGVTCLEATRNQLYRLGLSNTHINNP